MKIFFVFVFFFSWVFQAMAAELSNREEQKNVVSISILDQQLIYSLNYDRTFNKYFGAGLSASVIGGGGGAVVIGGLQALFYPIGGETTAPFITAGLHGMTGNDLGGFDSLDGSYGWGAAGVGVEYRNSFLFRGTILALFNGDGYLVPFPGFTFGYAF